MTPFSRPSVSFLRKHNKAKRLQAIAFVVSSISSSVSLTSLNNRLQTCEANGCSAASSLLSTLADLLRFKCRRFPFGPRLTAGDQPYKCDIQTQRRPPDSSVQPSVQQPKQVCSCDDDTPSNPLFPFALQPFKRHPQ